MTAFDLSAAARRSLRDHGFEPDFPSDVTRQLADVAAHPPSSNGAVRDLRNWLWSSIDNDTSRDLDQAEVVERQANGDTIVRIAIADVDAFVPKNSPVDKHAAIETTS